MATLTALSCPWLVPFSVSAQWHTFPCCIVHRWLAGGTHCDSSAVLRLAMWRRSLAISIVSGLYIAIWLVLSWVGQLTVTLRFDDSLTLLVTILWKVALIVMHIVDIFRVYSEVFVCLLDCFYAWNVDHVHLRRSMPALHVLLLWHKILWICFVLILISCPPCLSLIQIVPRSCSACGVVG